jgi:hypothetical protein
VTPPAGLAFITPVDLTRPVPDDIFATCLTLAWPAISQIAHERGWCAQWYAYARKLSPAFPDGRHRSLFSADRAFCQPPVPASELNELGLARTAERAGEHNRAALENMRKRILGHVVSGQITLEEANGVFAACGLPGCEPAAGSCHAVMELPSRIMIAYPASVAQNQARDALRQSLLTWLASGLPDGYSASEPSPYDGLRLRGSDAPNGAAIPRSGYILSSEGT